MLGATEPAVARILDKSLEGKDISQEEAVVLFDAEGPALDTLILAADDLAPPKQRHTAIQVFRRLRDEQGYAGGYDQVRRYIRSYSVEVWRR
jgi:hypothetical protein